MKHFFLIILIISSIRFCFGQIDTCNQRKVKGFIVQAFSKYDVVNLLSKKHTLIDIPERILFIPIEDLKDEFDIKTKIQEKINDEFYTFFPYQERDLFLKKCLGSPALRLQLSKSDIKMKLNTSKKYFKIKGRKHKYILYKIHYIEGEWLQIMYEVQNNDLSSNFKIELINKDVSEIKLYYLLGYSKLEEYNGTKIKSLKKFKIVGAE